jgi:hypothetical protein
MGERRGETAERLRGGRRAGEARGAESTARRLREVRHMQGAWRVLAAASRVKERGVGRRERAAQVGPTWR